MKDFFQNILQGMRDNFSILDNTAYRVPSDRGFAMDADSLRSDARRVANGMNEAVKKRDAQSDRRPR
ncbi:MAG: hypothetical protein LBK55_11905 [Azoarcus sp.]|jgi:hypothetical protein|nr:hypothetical protein [Azoarcus sp.]